jgi:hypothetical protein
MAGSDVALTPDGSDFVRTDVLRGVLCAERHPLMRTPHA